ncbi:hypothetical protein NE237_002719 [Protea cynaroides]|uniref:RFTS domain-containing protein n=1 Tax=Protea cynaroides TaxID=273540 RepID=A0A9Q0KFS6_9MAGN|nr:hypothetical protein NE237_002719 [Protea cynaroides]
MQEQAFQRNGHGTSYYCWLISHNHSQQHQLRHKLPETFFETGSLILICILIEFSQNANQEEGSGFEEGSSVICVSTDVVDYDCVKSANSNKKYYDHFFWKACSYIEIFKKLSKTYGGNLDLNLVELFASVVHSMSGSQSFPSGISIKNFVISQGEFIYNQLIRLDEPSQEDKKEFQLTYACCPKR